MTTIPSQGPAQWVIQEDYALKLKLSNYSVVNYADGKQTPVAVYFRFPDTEERNRTYPHIAIDLVDIRFDAERAHHALFQVLPFDLEQATPPFGFSLVADDMPLPWTLVYQLAVYARQPWQDRQLQMMMYRLFPQMYGSLNMSQFDGTVRRADLLSTVRRDTLDADRKRLYRSIFTVGISSEFYLNEVQYIQDVTSVALTLKGFPISVPA